MALFGLNLLMRRDSDRKPGVLSTVLSGIGAAGLLASAWYRGHLVYEHGLRVKGVDPLAGARDLRLPADEAIEEGFGKIEEAAMPPSSE